MSVEKIQYTPGLPNKVDYRQTWYERNRRLLAIISLVVIFGVILVTAGIAYKLSMSGLVKSVTGGSESSPYNVVRTLPNGMEERIYSAQKWATTEEIGEPHSMDSYKSGMFWALFGYITGKNDRNQKIAMTVPVSTKVEARDNNTFSYQMGFYIPREYQEDPPKPTDPKVKIVTRDLHVYTGTFGGYAKETDYDAKLAEVVAYLKENNIPIVTAHDSGEPIHFCVGYDAPHKFWNRKNEVWVLVE